MPDSPGLSGLTVPSTLSAVVLAASTGRPSRPASPASPKHRRGTIGPSPMRVSRSRLPVVVVVAETIRTAASGRFAEMTSSTTPSNYGASCDAESNYGTPVIVIHPGRLGGTPTIGHSRLSAASIAGTYWRYGADEVRRMWDYITDDDIKVCCWYIARYGTRAERARWKEWLPDADIALWKRDGVSSCPLPPRENQ